MRRLGYNIEDRREYILCSFGETKGEKGVGFIIRKQNRINILDFIGINERVALLQAQIEDKNYSILQVYAPTTEASDSEITSFYESLQNAIEKCGSNVIFMGDMNAKIGQADHNSIALGKYGYGSRNDRGELFIGFCQQNGFKIMNTVFNKPQRLRWTWESPDGRTRNEIDFIATNIPKCVENIIVISNFKFPSDHRMVRVTINVNRTKRSRRSYSQIPAKHFDKEKLKLSLSRELNKINYSNLEDPQESYDAIERIILNTLNECKIARKENKRQYIITKEVEDLINERHLLKKKINKTREEKNKLSKLYRTINKKIAENTKNYKLDILKKLLEKSGAVKKANKKLNPSKMVMSQLKSPSGVTVTNRDNIIEIVTQYYKNLYGHKQQTTQATAVIILIKLPPLWKVKWSCRSLN